MSEYVPTSDPNDCEKCGGSGTHAVVGGMFGTQECPRCDGSGLKPEGRR